MQCGTRRVLSVGSGVLIWAINQYQRYISPRKGFVCAHRVLNGGDSCSEAVKQAALTNGLTGACGMVRRRFRECGEAARLLSSRRFEERLAEDAERKRKKLQENEGKLPDWMQASDCPASACGLRDMGGCWW